MTGGGDDDGILSDDAFDSDDDDRYADAFRSGGDAGAANEDSDSDEFVLEGSAGDDGHGEEYMELADIMGEAERAEARAGRRGGARDDSEDEELDDSQHASMIARALSKGSGKKAHRFKEPVLAREIAPAGTDGEFDAGKQHSKRALTAADLLAGVTDDSMLSDKLKQRVASETKSRAKPLGVPLGRATTARVERSVAYDATSKEVAEWQPTVKRNREADQLRFNSDHGGRRNVTSGSMVDGFKATSELETEIESILMETGLTEDEVAKRESRELEMQTVSQEEVAQRQALMKQRRSLLFHQEMKAKRIKKIKSRKFRKLNKKDKEKQQELEAEEIAELGGEAAEAAQMREERNRARERMTQRHKNNSKWVKRQLALHREQQTDGSRQAIAEQLRIGERLRKKVMGDRKKDGDENSDDDEAWLEAAREASANSAGVGQNLWADPGQEEDAVEQAKTGLLGMRFMERGAEKAQAEVNDLLSQIDALEEESEDEDQDAPAQRKNQNSEDGELAEGKRDDIRTRSSKALVKGEKGAARRTLGASDDADEMANVEGGDKYMVHAVKRMASHSNTPTSTRLGEGVDVDGVQAGNADNASSATVSSDASGNSVAAKEARKKTRMAAKQAAAKEEMKNAAGDEQAPVNPWIAQGSNGAGGIPMSSKPRNKRRLDDATSKASATFARKLPRNADTVKSAVATGQDGDKSTGEEFVAAASFGGAKPGYVFQKGLQGMGYYRTEDSNNSSDDRAPATSKQQRPPRQQGKRTGTLSQEDLLARAFVTGDAHREDFEAAKQKLVETLEKKEDDKLPKALAGWGDWVGAGVKPRKKPSAFQIELEAKRAARRANRKPRQDDGLRHVLINEKKNHKAAKYTVAGVPHGFGGSKSVYEASFRNPLGPEWSTQAVHKAKIKPAILNRLGNVIAPIQKTKAKKSATKRRPLTR